MLLKNGSLFPNSKSADPRATAPTIHAELSARRWGQGVGRDHTLPPPPPVPYLGAYVNLCQGLLATVLMSNTCQHWASITPSSPHVPVALEPVLFELNLQG